MAVKVITQEEQEDTVGLNMRLSDSLKFPVIREAGYRQFKGQQGAYFASVPLSLTVNEALANYLGAEMEPRKPRKPCIVTGDDTKMYMQQIPRVINDMINERVEKDKSTRSGVVIAALQAYQSKLSHTKIPVLPDDLVDAIYEESIKTGIDKNEILANAVRNYLNIPK
jgi:hypothetical protein